MDNIEIQRKYEYYKANPDKFILDISGIKLLWYQKLILKMMIKKDSIIKGLQTLKRQ